MITSKSDTESKPIPYKYVVYKDKKEKYELIYKPDSENYVNRCLFVEPSLLNSDGNL